MLLKFSKQSANCTYKTQGTVLARLFAAASSSCRALLVQHSTKLWSLTSWQKAASWHHTCSSTTASVQLHCDAMLTSFMERENIRKGSNLEAIMKWKVGMKEERKNVEGREQKNYRTWGKLGTAREFEKRRWESEKENQEAERKNNKETGRAQRLRKKYDI